MKGYWMGESSFSILVTNWGTENVVLNSGCITDQIDLVTPDKQDPIWEEDESTTVARVCQSDLSTERNNWKDSWKLERSVLRYRKH